MGGAIQRAAALQSLTFRPPRLTNSAVPAAFCWGLKYRRDHLFSFPVATQTL
jgi:hypothetical protein